MIVYIADLYKENSPEFIYYLTLYNIFDVFLEDISEKIIVIENADPGYDWIFSKKPAGLITKYGGANSHMAIRSAEYNLPAAIGCGEQPFNRVVAAKKCLLDCQRKSLEPIELT